MLAKLERLIGEIGDLNSKLILNHPGNELTPKSSTVKF